MDVTIVLQRRDNPDVAYNTIGDVQRIDLGLYTENADGTGEQIRGPVATQWYVLQVLGVPDKPIARVKEVLEEWDKGAILETAPDGISTFEWPNLRKWHVHPRAVPNSIRQAFQNNEIVTVTWAQAKPYIRRKLRRITSSTQHDPADSEPVTDTEFD